MTKSNATKSNATKAGKTAPATKAPVAEQTKAAAVDSKVVIATNIVRNAYQQYAQQVSAGVPEADRVSPRKMAIEEIGKQLFPGENQTAARNTYFSLAFDRVLTEGDAAALAAQEKGKTIYSVYRLHKAKNKANTVSRVGLVTSQAAAKQLKALLLMDGFQAGKLEQNAKVA